MKTKIQDWVLAQEVMDKVNSGVRIYTYICGEWCYIKSAFILIHTGYIRFNISGHICGNNSISCLPGDTIEISY